jgi:hypothetical protein
VNPPFSTIQLIIAHKSGRAGFSRAVPVDTDRFFSYNNTVASPECGKNAGMRHGR